MGFSVGGCLVRLSLWVLFLWAVLSVALLLPFSVSLLWLLWLCSGFCGFCSVSVAVGLALCLLLPLGGSSAVALYSVAVRLGIASAVRLLWGSAFGSASAVAVQPFGLGFSVGVLCI